MTQPVRGEFQFIAKTAAHIEETINKLNELSTGTGVGANYYPDGAEKLKLRFGDHDRGISHVVLTPHEIMAVRSYIHQKDPQGTDPQYKQPLHLFKEADEALRRAQDYIREQAAKVPAFPAARARIS